LQRPAAATSCTNQAEPSNHHRPRGWFWHGDGDIIEDAIHAVCCGINLTQLVCAFVAWLASYLAGYHQSANEALAER
jgi:hypothetical protein